MATKKLTITGLTVHAEQGMLCDATIQVLGQKIQAMTTGSISESSENCLTFPSHYHLIPGRIDMHIHGANGADVMDATPLALDKIRYALAAQGTTGFLATTMTDAVSHIEQALKNIAGYQDSGALGAKILGVHLEGPFISPQRLGAHSAEFILQPDFDLFDQWQTDSGHQIRLVTMAPEVSLGIEFIHHLKQHNVIASIGHSDATLLTAETAIEAGVCYATHLFNAMRGFHHREPGCVAAILLDDRVMAELIVDDHHLHPSAIHLALKNKSVKNLVLVTDGMRAQCCGGHGEFELGGQTVFVKEGAARLSDGTLAGSILTMTQAVKNMKAWTNCSWSDLIALTSGNPASILGISDRKGSLSVGKDADMVVLDDQDNVVMTICEGQIVYEK